MTSLTESKSIFILLQCKINCSLNYDSKCCVLIDSLWTGFLNSLIKRSTVLYARVCAEMSSSKAVSFAAGAVCVWVQVQLWLRLWFCGSDQDTEKPVLTRERSTRAEPSTQPATGIPQPAGWAHTPHTHIYVQKIHILYILNISTRLTSEGICIKYG